MHCRHCGFTNGEEDHRCLRCGRRLPGIVISAPPGYIGANALAFASAPDTGTLDTASFTDSATFTPPRQEPLSFPAPAEQQRPDNIIPFDQIQRRNAPRPAAAPEVRPAAPAAPVPPQPVSWQSPPPRTAPPTQSRRAQAPSTQQGTLDFVPDSPLRTRKLKTEVEAQVFCEQPVATPTHRCVAAAIDAAFILIGFGILAVAFQLMGGSFGEGRLFWLGLAVAFGLVSLLYGLIWAIAGRETAGMAYTDLQLITFDGFPLDPRSRAVRYIFTWMSFAAGGLGLLWAVADEENLTWHDHISKTFPTVKEASGTFVKQRR